ncbi:AAA family ATPase, partial [Aquisalimonas sp.]|uniref:ATP-binding protein n=1 Tax=Aquisalimonas sp. TaxID=1872621 RepID=UPI0025BE31EE
MQLNFLGDLEVLRDGQVLALPPSKKTRALLAYLALNPRSFSREHLCDLLWEVPDDPRGSLRWSLSKLRRLVDEPGRPRILADRFSVGFDAAACDMDVANLRGVVEHGVEQTSTEVLEAAAARYRGSFLEGLDLSNLHDFHSWCVAEREQAARAYTTVVAALVQRLADAPDQALAYARAHVRLAPYDETVRATLIRLLVSLDRSDEAEQQYQLGVRMLAEVGVAPSGALHQAWRQTPGRRSAGAVLPPDGNPPTAALARPPPSRGLVGRHQELARLTDAFARARMNSRAGFVLLTGEPGIGKSRLLETVAQLARDASAFLLEASASELDTIRPFALWLDAFRRLVAGRGGEIFGAVDYDNRDRLFGALSGRLADESAERPVVLLFDDMQWCDESSAAALHYVARMNERRPLFGVLAARDMELCRNGPLQSALRGLHHEGLIEQLNLGPLSESAVRELIGEHAPQADSERLSRQSAGNPLLAIELARAEAAGGSGSSLDELVRERLAHLDAEGVEVLRWAAVLAPRITVDSLVRVTGRAAIRIGDVCEAAERMGILRATERGLRFSHDLVARSVYAAISPARCRVMHRRVAEMLAQDTTVDLEFAADLAQHALQSGDAELAAQAMVSAGRLCLRFFANEDALMLASKGVALAEQLPDARRVCLTLELRDIILNAGPLEDWQATADELVALAEQALEHGALAHARLGYQMASTVRWAHGQWADAQEEALQAERVTRNASARDHIIAMAETAKCLAMLERDLDQAKAMLSEAQALAARDRVSHHAIPLALGLLRFHDNRLDDAESHFKDARTLCKAGGDRLGEFQANEYLMMIAFERALYASALARCTVLVEIGEKLRDGSEAPFARAAEGLCRYAIDDDVVPLVASLEGLRNADAKYRLAYILTRAALMDLERGRLDNAVAHAQEALTYAQALERPTELMLAHFALAEAYRAAGDTAAHRRHTAALAGFDQAPV